MKIRWWACYDDFDDFSRAARENKSKRVFEVSDDMTDIEIELAVRAKAIEELWWGWQGVDDEA
jgi:hypothetical protein